MTNTEAFARIAAYPNNPGGSEEDVKINVVLPLLRALGYEDGDFNYERRTGRGYVDVAGDRFPVGIVVETKAPNRRPEDFVAQLEAYVFEKHRRDRATVAILTNGDVFCVYGITEAFFRGSLPEHQLERFRRSELRDARVVERLTALLDKGRNQAGELRNAILIREKEVKAMKERIQKIEAELQTLIAERDRINTRITELQRERNSMVAPTDSDSPNDSTPTPIGGGPSTMPQRYRRAASRHILRLLEEKGARSKDTGVQRGWLNKMLIGKVNGVDTEQAVSFGIIELEREYGKIQCDRARKTGPIRLIWLA